MQCTFPNCAKPAVARGWCSQHYRNNLRTGTPEGKHPHREGCLVEGCPNPHRALGYCSKHWQRLQKHGDPLWERGKQAEEASD